MPASKKTTSNKSTKPAAKKAPAKKGQIPLKEPKKSRKAPEPAKAQTPPERRAPDPDSIGNQIVPYLLAILALFIAVCYLLTSATGVVGGFIRTVLYGLLGGGACAVPLFILLRAALWKRDVTERAVGWRFSFSLIATLLIAILLHVFTGEVETLSPVKLWQAGQTFRGGGVIGGFVGGLLMRGFGKAGTLMLTISALVIFTFFLFGLTPHTIRVYIAYYLHTRRERKKALREEERPQVFRRAPELPKKQAQPEKKSRGGLDKIDNYDEAGREIDANPYEDISGGLGEGYSPEAMPDGIPSEDSDDSIDEARPDADIFNEVIRRTNEEASLAEATASANAPAGESSDGHIDLAGIFTEPEEDDAIPADLIEAVAGRVGEAVDTEAELELSVERRRLTETPTPTAPPVKEPEPEKRPYLFPPTSLLKFERPPSNVDISEELHSNATKLVETLRSFKVRTRIVNISRGPTITRYELAPEEGVKVRSITNLVDDIALNLATSGVRIEAPIPGKAAVGIEVPNKVVATVWLRELLENPKFQKSASDVTVALGMDVAGDPVYMDISKMPHLLVAGATGMGKSVCMNSIIVSLLYKASPDKVKLILIDPKKVELNVYNGLPHLLVPVVSDPKKAAGSLHWAVTEMERRYELIEGEGVRNLKNYNEAIADDPTKEQLPQIIIVIDEFADLMMTAPGDVEESVCRLAQKARAAGMYLIIATQRPQVSVITGLIKANVPSRIAFTVSSQIDSNVILGMGGAERLIGRGDMLYAPVGMPKPQRVQGGFVSEGEVEAVVDFIKRSCGEGEYDNAVIAGIEREAERCDKTKKGASDGAYDDEIGGEAEGDPMLRAAIELAVDSGKISTSLIQRRLSLGYGRAAKLIDRMEEMGIVSEPEGQKPRRVLISKQEFMEMVLQNDKLE